MSTAALGGITAAYDDVSHGDPLALVHGHRIGRPAWCPRLGKVRRAAWRVTAPDPCGARVAIGKGAAHLPNLEYPDQFDAEPGAFLKDL